MRDDVLLALRLWRDADRGSPWRARLTDLRDGGASTFVDVPTLLRYLDDAFGAEAGADSGADSGADPGAEGQAPSADGGA